MSRRLEERAKATRGLDSENRQACRIFQKQSKELEDDINNLKKERLGKVTNVFKMAEIVGGAKKQKEEAHTLMDPQTKEVATEEIKRVSLTHCVSVLKKNTGEPEDELWVTLKSQMHEEMMGDDKDGDTNINREDFDEVIDKFKKKKKTAYNFITKAGDKYQTSIYKL